MCYLRNVPFGFFPKTYVRHTTSHTFTCRTIFLMILECFWIILIKPLWIRSSIGVIAYIDVHHTALDLEGGGGKSGK